MKALMLAHIEVGDADLQRLAQQRAQAVHDWLAEKVDASRLHVSAAESVAAGGDEDDNGNTARVEFALK
jgi:outer membrane protein OmpA-like peptidoglycan-associated protein